MSSEILSPTLFQWFLCFVALLCGLLVVLNKNPVLSAVSLMATLFTTGLLYFTLDAYFVGAVQILIYAGAISVLFVFIVMLLDLKPTQIRVPGRMPIIVLGVAVGASFLLLVAAGVLPVLSSFGLIPSLNAGLDGGSQEPLAISLRLLSKYMLPFQVTALLLLAAIMGVVVIGKKNVEKRKS
jgi:NADH-quinone oxidoreductase subunit J